MPSRLDLLRRIQWNFVPSRKMGTCNHFFCCAKFAMILLQTSKGKHGLLSVLFSHPEKVSFLERQAPALLLLLIQLENLPPISKALISDLLCGRIID